MPNLSIIDCEIDNKEIVENQIKTKELNRYRNTAIMGLIGIVVFGYIFVYNSINPVGSFSLYTCFGFPTCWILLFLIGFVLLNSIIILLANTINLLNM